MTAPTPNAELAWRVLDHIDAHPETWDQSWWFIVTDCGTTGCFAGWTCVLSGDTPDTPGPIGALAIGEGSSMVELAQQGGYRHAADRAAELLGFGANDARADELFGAGNTREDLGRLVAEIFGPRPDAVEMSPPPCADHESSDLNCPVCTAQRRAFYTALGRELDGGEGGNLAVTLC